MNYESILENIINQESKLNEWESGFIDSVSNQNYPLTKDQKEKIKTINRKIHK